MSFKTIAILLISAGAIVMLIGILRYHSVIIMAQSFLVNRKQSRAVWYKIHHLLMIFFLLGYIGVLFSIVYNIRLASDLFTSVIFFFGASFVLIGILLQSAMLKSINKQHKQLSRRNSKIRQVEDATIYTLAYLAEIRDFETGKHIERTSLYVQVLAEELSQNPEYTDHMTSRYISDLVKSAPLHDIGKVGVPDEILKKPGKLTKEEFKLIEKHCDYGADVLEIAANKLSFQSYLTIAIQLARHHHERWDGKGYPDGLKGYEIPLSAQIMGIADVYDALRSKRCYKESFSHEKSCAIIEQEKGKQLAPDVIEAFRKTKNIFHDISINMAD